MDRRNFVKNTLVHTLGGYSLVKMGWDKISPDLPSTVITSHDPLLRVVDMDLNETAEIQLSDKKPVRARVVECTETRDPIFQTLTGAIVKIELDGKRFEIPCANYHLPVTVGGVQVDCPAVSGYMRDAGTDWWQLKKA